MSIKNVAVIGGGTMGSGIAEVAAKAGCNTIVLEIDAGLAEIAQNKLETSTQKAVARDKMTEEERDGLLSRLSFTTSFSDLEDRDLIIEAVVESPSVKANVFKTLDEVAQQSAILASNTSSISIGEIADSTSRGSQVLGMHFFNPATIQPLVELISSEVTSKETLDQVEKFTSEVLGKHPIRTIDRAGFVVNRLLVPYLLQAMHMFDRGQATKEDIDAGMKFGCAHPQGPLELSDLIGLDTLQLVAEVLYEEFKEPTYSPPPILKRMVTAGHLGRKTGKGFYTYE
ncbi:MAG: 3-hydroxybutyryl-CoA dehydrogenase [Acidimicrobiaceae bacterium]|nr:MAG: 3-hydroxybutyryl-CoA dehydrogenase [marine actinobacterium MedAcidi-G2A]MAT03068.1 3-hydroxybutyryl-CoA dehydrogenase [Acidimicrobiaceae bacterium]MBA4809575.1 3-hydroxybutyryl-CoA dehydrogenase [Acidimicrobiales bacterium]OUV00069.1 MAG: 3-hydroxybutyryl-CoA dehydrogenase [Acidimicrobiaceae bacterium TMED77]|tara:strand:+ start:2825 stop:3679 length:855 start_codon:yes stop_codon:yes gene_type:complete